MFRFTSGGAETAPAGRLVEKIGAAVRAAALWSILLLPVVVFLALAGAGSMSPDDLLAAAQAGDAATVEASLSRRVPVDSADAGGFTPLMIAARAGRTGVVAQLLAAGAKVNARTAASGTALTQASLYGHVEIVALLLARGADPNAQTDQGQTPLWYAMTCPSSTPEVAEMLLAAGADPNARCFAALTP